MLKRKLYNTLLNWKNARDGKCLLLKGARQVGKTYIIREFGKKEYESLIEINFIEHPEYKAVFEGSLSADKILSSISLLNTSFRMIPGKTLLFLDEIQECPAARTALKFLATEDEFDVIASGSLLGISFKDVPSIPVGYENQIFMYPLDFEEFLWAKGYSDAHIAMLRDSFINREKINPAVNDTFLSLIREYMVVGGMPAVVNIYLETNNFGRVHEMQSIILHSYYDDISKYAETYEKPKIKKCYESIPAQLAKENKKFQYSIVEKGATARKFGNSMEWLRDSGLIYMCVNTSTPSFPLKAYEDSDFYKAYMSDIGLLISLYGYDMKAAIIHDTLSGPAKGGLYENLVACMLVARGYPLRYYKAQTGNVEIEFLIEKDGAVCPVEVKAKNGSSKSLNEILKREELPMGYKLISGNVGESDKKLSLPLYMAMFL